MNVELLRKIAELAKRGVGGEAENAQSRLIKMLAAEGLGISDLESVLREVSEEWITLRYKNVIERRMCDAAITSALKTYNVKNRCCRGGKGREYLVPVNKAVEIKAKVDKALKAWRKELHLFEVAWRNRQGLVFAEEGSDDSGLSPEAIESICTMMSGIEKLQFNRQIEGE